MYVQWQCRARPSSHGRSYHATVSIVCTRYSGRMARTQDPDALHEYARELVATLSSDGEEPACQSTTSRDTLRSLCNLQVCDRSLSLSLSLSLSRQLTLWWDRHLASYPEPVTVPNPAISRSLLEPIEEHRTCRDALIPDLYCAENLAQKKVCWESGNDCELAAEADRALLIQRVLRGKERRGGKKIVAVPSAEDIYRIRLSQRLLDACLAALACGLAAMLLALYCCCCCHQRDNNSSNSGSSSNNPAASRSASAPPQTPPPLLQDAILLPQSSLPKSFSSTSLSALLAMTQNSMAHGGNNNNITTIELLDREVRRRQL